MRRKEKMLRDESNGENAGAREDEREGEKLSGVGEGNELRSKGLEKRFVNCHCNVG